MIATNNAGICSLSIGMRVTLMKYELDNMYAYRFYEKKDGPLVTIRNFNENEVSCIGSKAGITNIQEIYKNRTIIEDLLYRMFIKKGGKPQIMYPYYATVFDVLPDSNQLHIRFNEPECIKIPMKAFSKEHVSFTYGQSPRALTRKDNHPTRRKVLMWDEAELAINQFPFVEDEGTWLEMQIWEEDVIKQYYADGKGGCITAFEVKERLNEKERKNILKQYEHFLNLLESRFFFEPQSAHGISHAMRVLVLSQRLAESIKMEDEQKSILIYGALYHDIGRDEQSIDSTHGYKSFQKVIKLGLIAKCLDTNSINILRFIIENHPMDTTYAKKNIKQYNIDDEEKAYKVLKVLKDADTLDRCRFGHIETDYLSYRESRKLIPFAYQLLTIYREAL